MKISRDTLIVFVLLAFSYAFFFQEPSWNGNSRLGLTYAIVREGRLTIDSFHNNKTENLVTGDLSLYNGHYYTDKAIGTSLLAVLFYFPLYWISNLLRLPLSPWFSKYLLTFLTIGLFSAIAGAYLYDTCKLVSGSKFRSFIVTIAIFLGTMGFPFGLVFFSHTLAAALLSISFCMILRLKMKPELGKNFYNFLIGLLLGLSLITEYTTLVIILPLAIYYLYVSWRIHGVRLAGSLLWPVLGGLIPLMLMFGYNTLSYGSPLVTGYQYEVNPVFREEMSKGLMGIGRPHKSVLFFETVQPAMGIFWQSPVLIMALVGAVFMFLNKSYRWELAVCMIAFFSYLVINAGYYMWWGGWSFAPRQMIPMLPFIGFPLIFVPKRIFPLVVVLTIVSVFQMMIVAASTPLVPDTLLDDFFNLHFFDYSTIYSYCLPYLLKGKFAWNIGQGIFGLRRWASLIPLFMFWAGGLYLLRNQKVVKFGALI